MQSGRRTAVQAGCKKDAHVIGFEGKKINLVRTCAPGRKLRGRRRLHGQTPDPGSGQAEPQPGRPGPD